MIDIQRTLPLSVFIGAFDRLVGRARRAVAREHRRARVKPGYVPDYTTACRWSQAAKRLAANTRIG